MDEHPVILFDGVCGLCHRTVRFILARDRTALFRFAALQSDIGRSLAAARGIDATRLESIVLIESSQAWQYATAVRRIGSLLGGWTATLSALSACIPSSLLDRLYRRVARTRYARFGRYETCPLPDPQWSSRFLT